MPDVIPCPYCPRKLQVPVEVLGQPVRCPSCGQTFVAGENAPEPQPPAAPDTALAELYEHVRESQPAAIVAPLPSLSISDEPRTRGRESLPESSPREPGSLEDWRKVQQGIELIWHGLVIGIVTMLSAMCVRCGFSGMGGADPEIAVFATIVVGLVVLAGLTSVTLHLVGQVFCLRSPLENSARPLARISLALLLLLLGFGIGMLSWVEGIAGRNVLPFAGLGDLITLGSLVMLVQVTVLLLCLRALAMNVRQQRLATSIRRLTFLVGGIVAAMIAIHGAVIAVNTTGRPIDEIGVVLFPFACALVILAPIFLIWYVVVLSELRQAVTAYVWRRERQEG